MWEHIAQAGTKETRTQIPTCSPVPALTLPTCGNWDHRSAPLNVISSVTWSCLPHKPQVHFAKHAVAMIHSDRRAFRCSLKHKVSFEVFLKGCVLNGIFPGTPQQNSFPSHALSTYLGASSDTRHGIL